MDSGAGWGAYQGRNGAGARGGPGRRGVLCGYHGAPPGLKRPGLKGRTGMKRAYHDRNIPRRPCAVILIVLGIYKVEGINALYFLLPNLSMAIKSGVFEELLFRGVLFRSVEAMFGSWVGIIVSSLVFGLLHLMNPGATLGGAIYISIEAGLLLAAAYLVTRRLWIAMGFHMGWNYFQSAVFSGVVSGAVSDPGLLKARIEGPELLTGGSFGMEHSVVALVLCTTAGVILLAVAVRRGHMLAPMWKR